MPAEEIEISNEDFREIVSLVNSLELFLGESNLPSSLVALIRRHIKEAELALAEYPLRGAIALKEAMKAAIGDLIVDQDAYEKLPPEASSKLKKLWSQVNRAADGAIKAEGLIQVGGRVQRALEFLQS